MASQSLAGCERVNCEVVHDDSHNDCGSFELAARGTKASSRVDGDLQPRLPRFFTLTLLRHHAGGPAAVTCSAGGLARRLCIEPTKSATTVLVSITTLYGIERSASGIGITPPSA